jgi:hypothetical protein
MERGEGGYIENVWDDEPSRMGPGIEISSVASICMS